MMTAASNDVVLKQFLLVQFTRMPAEFQDALINVFAARWHRVTNQILGDGPGIICDCCNVGPLYSYARDCGRQLGRHHMLVQLEYVEMLFACMRSIRSRLDVRQKGPPQRCHVVVVVQ